MEFREAVNTASVAMETGGRKCRIPSGIGRKWSFNPCSADDPG